MLAAIEEHAAGARLHRLSEQSDRQSVRRRGDRARASKRAPGLVVIDEAYHAFAGASLHAIASRAIRTCSSCARCPSRASRACGWACSRAPREWLTHLDKVRLPYNVNVLTQLVAERGAAASVAARRAGGGDQGRARRGSTTSCERMPGVDAFPERREFHTVQDRPRPSAIFDGLKDAAFSSRTCTARTRCSHDCLRVTVGTPEENDRFLARAARVA